MNFHSFVLLFGLMSKATLQERLKLLYILHLSRLLDLSNSGEYPRKYSHDETSKNLQISLGIYIPDLEVLPNLLHDPCSIAEYPI